MFFNPVQPETDLTGLCSMKNGVYEGNGVDDREVDIGVNLAGKSYVWVIVKSIYNYHGLHRIEVAQGGYSNYFTADQQTTAGIKSFTDKGFTVGSTHIINLNGWVYHYVAIWVD